MSKMFDSELNVIFSRFWNSDPDMPHEDNEGWFTVVCGGVSLTPNGAIWVDTREELHGFIKGAATAMGIEDFDMSDCVACYHGWTIAPCECATYDVGAWCDIDPDTDAPMTTDDARAIDAIHDAKLARDVDALSNALDDYYETTYFEENPDELD